MLELGVPYSDPLADGPVIHEAGTRALAAGANIAGVLEVARALAPSVPVVLMCYANMVFAPGVEAFVERLARTGACGLIVPDLPLEEAPAVLAACDARGLALVPLVAPTTPPARLAQIGARRAGFLYTVSCVGTTGERAALAGALRGVVARAKAERPTCRSRWASGSAPRARALRPPAAGADGVIVGTRLVRAAGRVGRSRGRGRGAGRGARRRAAQLAAPSARPSSRRHGRSTSLARCAAAVGANGAFARRGR